MSLYVDIKKRLGDFSLQVCLDAEEECLALLGDSGCGKTMTLKCIAGVERPDEGVIRINGKTVFDSAKGINLPSRERRVGYLFQNCALFPHMTVTENIMVGLEREKRLSKAQRREKAMEFGRALQLEAVAGHYPYQLSGGQQQRTALARILASRPDILLLDEPFSALDATLRWEMEQLVRHTIADFSGTTVLVTHDRDEVYRLSHRLAVYNAGRVDRLGEKWALFADPQTATAARLTGCKNISHAHREGDWLVAEDWGLRFPAPDGEFDAVGIRAHRFRPAEELGEGVFPFRVVERIEDTFSVILQIRAEDAPEAKPLRWELDKALAATVSDRALVCVPPGELLLLKR